MQMNKFEEKARDFLIDSGIIPAEAVGKGSLFHVVVDSVYKSKKLVFQTKDVAFEVSAENYSIRLSEFLSLMALKPQEAVRKKLLNKVIFPVLVKEYNNGIFQD